MSSLVKNTKAVIYQPPDELVWVPAQTLSVTWADSRLTDASYAAVKGILAGWGYAWSKTYQFSYSLTYNSGSLLDVAVGWNVTFYSVFANGLTPAPLWIRDSWVTIPYGYVGTKTIAGHYENVTPAPIVTETANLGWTGAAVSKKCFSGDGIIQFRLDQTNTGSVCGLNRLAVGYTETGYSDIQYGIKSAGAFYQIVENGVTKTSPAAFVSTDVFSITRIAGVVDYNVNGDSVYTSTVELPDYQMIADASLYEAGDAIYDALIAAIDAGVLITLPDRIQSSCACVVSYPLESDCAAFITNAIENSNEIWISRAIENDCAALIHRSEIVVSDCAALIAWTEQVIADCAVVVEHPQYDRVVSDCAVLIEVEGDLESVVVDIHAPAIPVYGAY